MNHTENNTLSTWERIQNGVGDTERLIGQKKYNMAMVKARQTLEYMVTCLCEKSGTPQGSLIDMIDALYEDGIISKTTSEHYHKIRTIGNKAIHEEDNSAYNANQAHHLLSQEVYTFANDYKERRKKPSSASRKTGIAEPAQRSRSSASSRGRVAGTDNISTRSSRSSGSGSNRRRAYSSRPSLDLESILKPLLLIAIIIVLIFIIKMIHPGKATPESTAEIPMPSVTAAPRETTTEVPKETESTVTLYKTTDILNVRSSPSTDNERIGVLNAGSEVEFLGDYDDRWAIIKFNGAEAYVVKEYLTPVG